MEREHFELQAGAVALPAPWSYYCTYMKHLELPLTRIGNSRGVRLPAALLKKYGFSKTIILEQRASEIVLRPKRDTKLSWEETAKEMAAEHEDWSDMEATEGGGLDDA
jgi:antitoxin MazE